MKFVIPLLLFATVIQISIPGVSFADTQVGQLTDKNISVSGLPCAPSDAFFDTSPGKDIKFLFYNTVAVIKRYSNSFMDWVVDGARKFFEDYTISKNRPGENKFGGGALYADELLSDDSRTLVERLATRWSLDSAISGDKNFKKALLKDDMKSLIDAKLRAPGTELAEHIEGHPLLEFFNENPDYKQMITGDAINMEFLYREPSGVAEGYTLGEHTSRVLDVYAEQKIHYKLNKVKVPEGMRGDSENMDRFMRYTLALHDIGKSFANRGGDKGREEVYTIPLMSILMSSSGFNPSEVKVATALIANHQTTGSYLKGEITLDEAIYRFKANAAAAQMDPKEFFKLQEVIYACDAGAYPGLKTYVFERTPAGKMVPKAKKYQALLEAFS